MTTTGNEPRTEESETLDGRGVATRAVAMVHGATEGLGPALLRRLAADGIAMMLVGDDEEAGALHASRDSVTRNPSAGRVVVFTADLSDPTAARLATEAALTEFGRLDFFIDLTAQSAAVSSPTGVASALSGDTHGDAPLGAVRSTYLLAASAARRLREGGSVVLAVPFVAAGAPADVAAAHGAMQMLVRTLSLELAPYQVRVNGVMPGLIEIDESDHGPVREVPLGRAGRPDEVADAIAFLLSADAAFVTGSVLPVDGALSATAPLGTVQPDSESLARTPEAATPSTPSKE